jgi:hypothetical protein
VTAKIKGGVPLRSPTGVFGSGFEETSRSYARAICRHRLHMLKHWTRSECMPVLFRRGLTLNGG